LPVPEPRWFGTRYLSDRQWGEGQIAMSQISKAIFGVLAISVACGGAAAQLAFGQNLTGHELAAIGPAAAAAAPESGINRAAKSDRDAVRSAPAQTQTIVLRLNGLPDTSVLVRMPAAKAGVNDEARNRPAPSMMKPVHRKTTVACEPVVSVLTEVAKLLEPGRCVT
jgi:hypothetical protein